MRVAESDEYAVRAVGGCAPWLAPPPPPRATPTG
jgi:hypothetical protein